jgi:hypothetical protein
MKRTKRQIEARLDEIAEDMATSEFAKKFERYYDLKEEQATLADKLARGDYAPATPLPTCENCLRPTAHLRLEHVIHGDAAQGWHLCPRCQPPTEERWLEIGKIKHRKECSCGQYPRQCPYRPRPKPKTKLIRHARADWRFE